MLVQLDKHDIWNEIEYFSTFNWCITMANLATDFYFQACQQLQEYEEAIEAFNEVLRLEPDNREAQAQLKQSRNMRKALVDKEKKMYASMFKKLLTEDKRCEVLPKLPECDKINFSFSPFSANQTPSQTGSVSA